MRPPITSLLLVLASCAAPGALPPATRPGAVLAVGGGGTPDAALAAGIECAFPGPDGVLSVVVIPHASQREDRGVGSAAMWLEAGAGTAVVLSDDAETARGQLGEADLVWMSGGDQNRLLDHLEGAGLVGDLRAAHARGAVVGGTSAGAAVLGDVSIAGSPDPAPYHAGALPGRPGLGLLPGVLVDQHFAERGREGRLLTALLDHPELVGLGIGERTAALFRGRRGELLGEGVALRLAPTADDRFTVRVIRPGGAVSLPAVRP